MRTRKQIFKNGEFNANFPSALHKACGTDDLRPLFKHVVFENGYAYVTDAHILVRQSLNFINIEGANYLNGKRIRSEIFQRIYNEKNVIVRAFPDYIEVEYLSFGNTKMKFDYSTDDHNAPKYEAIIPKIGESIPKPEYSAFAINHKIFARLMSAMKISSYSSVVTLFIPQRNNQSIIVTDTNDISYDEQLGLIMPVHVSNDFH